MQNRLHIFAADQYLSLIYRWRHVRCGRRKITFAICCHYFLGTCRKLYWADMRLGKIMVSELNGTLHYSVISAGLSSPRAVVVHPLLG